MCKIIFNDVNLIVTVKVTSPRFSYMTVDVHLYNIFPIDCFVRNTTNAKCIRVVPKIGQRWLNCANGNSDKIYSLNKTLYVLEFLIEDRV